MTALAIVLGAIAGSFLNVVIARLPAGESIVRPRSRCPRCKTPIAWYDNVPIVSYVLLRGRCRHCREPISIRYPLIEAAIALVALLALRRHGPSPAALVELAAVSIVLALAVIDLDTWLLPNALTWPLIAVGLTASAAGLSPAMTFGAAASGAAVGFVAFALVAWAGKRAFKREALGLGDVWLLSGIGAFLGLSSLLPVVLLASIQGSLVGIALLLLGRLRGGRAKTPPAPDGWMPPKNAIPFGPFLAAAALEWLYLNDLVAGAIPVLDVFR